MLKILSSSAAIALTFAIFYLINRLKDAEVRVLDDDPLEGFLRVYVFDPFGNRIELMELQNVG
jgi:hypothetical protein